VYQKLTDKNFGG